MTESTKMCFLKSNQHGRQIQKRFIIRMSHYYFLRGIVYWTRPRRDFLVPSQVNYEYDSDFFFNYCKEDRFFRRYKMPYLAT